MPLNGRPSMSPLTPNSEGAPPDASNGAGQFYDATRRRDRIRIAAAQRGFGEAMRETRGQTKKAAEAAAEEMCNLLKQGRLRRADVEAEQRADVDRMVGLAAVGGEPGTGADRRRADIEYRMLVRELALSKFSAYELSDSISTARPGQTTAAQPRWTQRPGLPSGGHRGRPLV